MSAGSVALVATALGALLAGCAAPHHPTVGPNSMTVAPTLADISATPTVAVPSAAPTDLGSLRLPAEQYVLTPAENALLNHAMWVLAADCAHHHGVDFHAPPALTHQRSGGEVSRRYGPADPAAAEYGYHNAPAPDDDKLPSDSLGSLPDAERATVYGCRKDAETRLSGGAEFGTSALGEQINSASYKKAVDDDRVKAAFAAWSGCMKTAGHDYATPIDAYNDPHWRGSPTADQQELATVRADVDCKQRTDLIGIWYSVEAGYQQLQIQAHQAELDRARTNEQHQLGEARKVLGQ
ncbi:hypothetical protein ACIGXI_36970 [Kitasatospora aureofaciens]|uniref:hypothetical protein n=1 Tax=Kitasatospora aureofaciens TaxID=1894 RepID=UPI0037CAE50F